MWQRGALKRWRARMRLKGLAELMNILVTFAVEAEFTPWRNRRKFRRLPGDWPRFEAKFGGASVRAVLTGMGEAHAREAARRMLPDRPDICISTGLAGSAGSGVRPRGHAAAPPVGGVGGTVAGDGHPAVLGVA